MDLGADREQLRICHEGGGGAAAERGQGCRQGSASAGADADFRISVEVGDREPTTIDFAQANLDVQAELGRGEAEVDADEVGLLKHAGILRSVRDSSTVASQLRLPFAGKSRQTRRVRGDDVPPNSPDGSVPAEGLERHAEVLDDLSRGRFSGFLFAAILVFPLGCAFVAAFLIAITLLGVVVTWIGLRESTAAGQVALVAAIAIAAAVVVAVYRRVIPRLPWLRRLVNR